MKLTKAEREALQAANLFLRRAYTLLANVDSRDRNDNGDYVRDTIYRLMNNIETYLKISLDKS